MPDEWLHLTTQGIAFADEVTDAARDPLRDAIASVRGSGGYRGAEK